MSFLCIKYCMNLETKQLLFEQEINNFSATLNDYLADIIICDQALLLVLIVQPVIYTCFSKYFFL